LPDELLTLETGCSVVFCNQGYNGYCFPLPEIIDADGRAGFRLSSGQFCDLDHVVPVSLQAVHQHWYEALEQVVAAHVTDLHVDEYHNLNIIGYNDAEEAAAAGNTSPRLEWQDVCAKLIYGRVLPEAVRVIDKVNGNKLYGFTQSTVYDCVPVVQADGETVYEELTEYQGVMLHCPTCNSLN
jgi:hypothetical protein